MNEVVVLSVTIANQRSRSFWEDSLRSIIRDKLTLLALAALLLLTLICIVGPPIIENVLKLDPNQTRVIDRYLPPGQKQHILGTDQLGRDQLIRLLYGGRISLAIAFSASLMSITIGVTLGLIAGFYGGRIDDIIIGFINTLSSIPTIFLLLIASTLWTPSPEVLIVILALLGWVGTCRLVRGEVIAMKERDFILAARALGSSGRWLILHHILPNILSIVIIALTINAGSLILVESGLSFLGLGVQPPTATWGNMLTDSRDYFVKGVHLVVWPGALITLTVLCFYLIGDGLRDALDPRSSRK